MSRIVFGFSLVALAAGLSGETIAQTKPKVVVATDNHYALLSTYADMSGVVQGTTPGVGKSPGMITLRVQFDYAKNPAANVGPTPAQQQRMAKLQQDLAAVGNIKEPAKRQQTANKIQADMATLQQQMQAAAAKPVAMTKELIDYDLPFAEKAVVRKKGGEEAKFEDLNKGDEVKVTFAKKVAATTAPPKKDSTGALEAPANRPRIREVSIVKDAPEPPAKKNK